MSGDFLDRLKSARYTVALLFEQSEGDFGPIFARLDMEIRQREELEARVKQVLEEGKPPKRS
ncbi:hypothetical protein HPO_18445 [Hyphomonas polymorpha PS728]|uniref:Uncharacterized protein n=1 Tax=Hyphomonas polymorpha PS728 TaxID=1280954 RepID=A0A062V9C8_9PROT|nr:hypothetical protein [Hyphomonas polymorpha]KCZ96732.1 hypothetical protein HPO_18445 [Hyphomonas polymorpha PS728]